jgi:hypothetical protein
MIMLDISRDWGNIRDCIKISAKDSLGHYMLKQHKRWFGENCSKFLDRRKGAKITVVAESTPSEGR